MTSGDLAGSQGRTHGDRESERGQALVMVMAAMVIDVGYAYYAIFTDIATDIAKGTSALIDNDVS